MERSILNIMNIHIIKSEAIRQKTKLTAALTKTQKLKGRWAGHVLRYKDDRCTVRITGVWKGPK